MTPQLETLLISYIPSNNVHDCELMNQIESFPLWVKLSEATYAVATDLTPSQVYDRIAILPSQDQVYIITLMRPHFGQGSRKVDEWLHSNLSTPKRLPVSPPDLIR